MNHQNMENLNSYQMSLSLSSDSDSDELIQSDSSDKNSDVFDSYIDQLFFNQPRYRRPILTLYDGKIFLFDLFYRRLL